jgi:hypothetical protein
MITKSIEDGETLNGKIGKNLVVSRIYFIALLFAIFSVFFFGLLSGNKKQEGVVGWCAVSVGLIVGLGRRFSRLSWVRIP